MLKHLPEKALETSKDTLLLSRKKVVLTGDGDRRVNNDKSVNNRSNRNLTERVTKCQEIIKTENIYKIPLKFLSDLGLINFPFKFNTKFIFTLETNMNRLFESNAKLALILGTVDAEIIFTSTPYIL